MQIEIKKSIPNTSFTVSDLTSKYHEYLKVKWALSETFYFPRDKSLFSTWYPIIVLKFFQEIEKEGNSEIIIKIIITLFNINQWNSRRSAKQL